MYTVILRMVRDQALAEDLCQEAFVKAFRAMGTFDRDRKLASWLFKIAHNTTLDYLRRKRLDLVPLEEPDDEAPDHRQRYQDTKVAPPDQSIEREDIATAIEEAIADLPPHYREIVSLRYQEELPYHEIAGILEMPMGTVKTHIHRARRKLMESLEARGFSPQAVAG